MKKIKLQADGSFYIKSQGRYVLCGCKHGDTAYVRVKDTWNGVVYNVDGINWEDILQIEDEITWEEFLDVIYDIKEVKNN